ncbi:MAG: caspase family protein [Cyanobacteria bacterium P01_D01_bin.1]
MANYWAITIGINQYRHLQPLMHAQNDARSIYRFFTDLAGVPSSHCALLSDLTTSVGEQAVYPDKPAIAEWVQTITQQVGADDVLWIFFSGYGVQSEHADYLLPIDGEPDNVKETGIAVVDLINTLAQLPTDKTLLILDMNRSQGAFAGQTIGTETLELARKHQIPLLLSCQPEQFSHETLVIRQGLFTAAMLEALQQECTTLGELSDYIGKRLPELCEHHWRPIQNAVSLVFEGQKDSIVVPDVRAPFTDVAHTPIPTPPEPILEPVLEPISEPVLEPIIESTTEPITEPITEPLPEPVINTTSESATLKPVNSSAVANGTTGAVASSTAVALRPEHADYDQSDYERPEVENGFDNNTESSLEPDSSSAIVPYGRGSDDAINGAKLRNWGLLALAILLLGGVLFRQPAIRTAMQDLANRVIALTGGDAASDADTSPDDGTSNDATDGSTEPEADIAAGSGSTQAPTADALSEDNAGTEATQSSDSPVAASPDTVPAATGDSADGATGADLIAQANASLDRQQYSEALVTLQQVPTAQRDSTFAEVLTRARAGAATAQQTNASVLNDARTSIQPIQASQFSEAIAKARLIQPGEPFYEEAQQNIRSWSQVILDIAEGRATSGNLDSAIAAASVMPYDNAELYQASKDRIAFWKQRQNSRAIIADAQTIPRTGQASSYQKGIVRLREVSIEHPEYETAQRLADEWSQRIFSIAQARAAQGRLREAVQAAVLVPAGTAAYEPTQQAIRRWQAE